MFDAIFYLITGEIFITSILVSIAFAFVAVLVLIWRVNSSAAAAIAGLAALLSSKAFLDDTMFGLENSMNYLLVEIFCACLLRGAPGLRMFRRLILVASLAVFNRLDLALMFVPAIADVAWYTWSREKVGLGGLVTPALIYSFPVWGWLIFATIYFGFLFPNTYYAKLYTGVAKDELRTQGLLYYINSLNTDPATWLSWGSRCSSRSRPEICGSSPPLRASCCISST